MEFLEKLNGKQYYWGYDSMTMASGDDFSELQIGFRTDGEEEDNLISDEPDGWKKTWYVIGIDNMMGDPYFIDTQSNKIYVVGHDCDYETDTVLLARNIDEFIKKFEIIDDNLNSISHEDLDEKIALIDKTMSEIESIADGIDNKYFFDMVNISLGIEDDEE